jgi:hypothetical protein
MSLELSETITVTTTWPARTASIVRPPAQDPSVTVETMAGSSIKRAENAGRARLTGIGDPGKYSSLYGFGTIWYLRGRRA